MEAGMKKMEEADMKKWRPTGTGYMKKKANKKIKNWGITSAD
jgi:hypothetical protein